MRSTSSAANRFRYGILAEFNALVESMIVYKIGSPEEGLGTCALAPLARRLRTLRRHCGSCGFFLGQRLAHEDRGKFFCVGALGSE